MCKLRRQRCNLMDNGLGAIVHHQSLLANKGVEQSKKWTRGRYQQTPPHRALALTG